MCKTCFRLRAQLNSRSSRQQLHHGEYVSICQVCCFFLSYFKEIHLKTSSPICYNHVQGPFQYPIRRLIARSRGVTKPQDRQFKLSHRCEIWQARRQQCCRGACQISERSNYSKYKFRGIDTSRSLTIRRLIGWWNGVQASMSWNHDEEDVSWNDMCTVCIRRCSVLYFGIDILDKLCVSVCEFWLQRSVNQYVDKTMHYWK